jgi:hypothetical protein
MTLDELRTCGKAFIGVPAAIGLFDDLDARTLRAAISDGQLPGVHVGRRVFVSVPGLLAILDPRHGDGRGANPAGRLHLMPAEGAPEPQEVPHEE